MREFRFQIGGQGQGGVGQRHRATVIGPDGRRHEPNLGGGFGGEPGHAGAVGRVETQVRGSIVIVGPDGQARTFHFGDGGAPRGGEDRGEGRREIRLRRLAPGGGHGSVGGPGPIMGEVVIVGPDGREQTFNFGGDRPDLQVHRFENADRFFKIPDGAGPGVHLWKVPGGDGRGGGTLWRQERPTVRHEGGWVM
jgi:hypothetical protein